MLFDLKVATEEPFFPNIVSLEYFTSEKVIKKTFSPANRLHILFGTRNGRFLLRNGNSGISARDLSG